MNILRVIDMRISTYVFNKYLNQSYIDNFESDWHGEVFKDKDITFLTFDKWKIFYEADPDSWKFHHDTYEFVSSANIYYPYYLYIKDGRNAYRIIKFPNKREYKKFYRFYKKNIEDNLDGRENQQEILELSQIIGEKAKIRTAEAQRELTEGYKNLLSKTCSSDDIQTYFAKRDFQLTTDTNEDKKYFPNQVPYRVVIKRDVKVYRYCKSENCMSNEYIYYMHPGSYVISEEKFINGIVYCKVMSKSYTRQNDWIKLADIDKKVPL
jgi:hypothetical protein